jgi:hypothetical protein
MAQFLRSDPTLEAEELEAARREVYRAKRSTLLNLRQSGMLSEEGYEQLIAELDGAMDAEAEATWEEGEELEAPHTEPLPPDA